MFHLGRITLEGEFPAHSDEALSLKSGDKAEAELVLAARDKLLNVLHEDGYALAKIEEPIATLNEEAENVDVVFHVNSGSKVNLGQIRVNGLVKLNESFVRNRLLIKSGQPYKSTEIDAARVDLTGLGVFSSVRTGVAEQLDSLGKIPLDINVVERPLHAVNLGAAYATDVGGNLSGSWLHRNLFGNAEQLNLTAALTQLGGNSTTGIGYKVGASLNTPDYLARDQTLLLGLQAFQQNFQAYDETALVANLLLTRKLNAHWQFGYGIEAQQAQITQNDVIRNFTLFSLPVTLKYDSSDSPLNPVSGSIANIALTPIESLANVGQKTFLLMQVGASSYFDLAKSGWSVLAIRGLVGSSGGASQFELPPDKRFYAGGSSTVRGYKYQSIGPKFANNSPEGGSAIAAASVELRQKILDEYGIVAFADAGQVSVDGLPFSGGWQLGVGMGLRYYSSFGPIRVDVALPVNPQPGSGSYELYIGLGQAF
jgi:translocation and assembly module TamA